jgi:hypothetical protein
MCFARCVAACRLIMRLHEFSNRSNSVYVHTAASVNAYGPGANRFPMVTRNPSISPEIHVTTDHFVVDDFECVLLGSL